MVVPVSLADAGHLEILDSGKVDDLARPVVPSRSPAGVAFFRCDVVRGRVLTCSGGAEGAAVLEQDDGLFRGCDLAAGRILSCGGWASGVVPVFDAGLYVGCRVEHGRVVGCFGPFDGQAVIERGPGGP